MRVRGADLTRLPVSRFRLGSRVIVQYHVTILGIGGLTSPSSNIAPGGCQASPDVPRHCQRCLWRRAAEKALLTFTDKSNLGLKD
jgi:hypothetical protein